MSSVTSSLASKIPLAVVRHPAASPPASAGSSPSHSSAETTSRIPKLSSSGQRSNGNGWAQQQPMPPRKGSTSSNGCFPARSAAFSEESVFRKDSTNGLTAETQTEESRRSSRSVDIEDEFNSTIQRQRQLVRKQRESNGRNRSIPNVQGGSPSRIPVAADCLALGSDGSLKKSSSNLSLNSAPSPSRKISAPAVVSSSSSSSATTPASSRGNSPAKSFAQSRNGGSQEQLLKRSNASINSETFDESGTSSVGLGLGGSGSKIPLPKSRRGSSPPKLAPKSTTPIFGFSLKTERQEMMESPRAQPALRQTEGAGSSQGKAPKKSSFSLENNATHSFCNKENDVEEDLEGESRGSKKKKLYEAYVMTGDRMINLAKTPANNEFRSKYYKPSSAKQVPLLDQELESVSVPSSPSPQERSDSKAAADWLNVGAVRLREQAATTTKSEFRTSKSEDQLLLLEDGYPDQEDRSGSVYAFLNSHGAESSPLRTTSTPSSCSTSPSSRIQHQLITTSSVVLSESSSVSSSSSSSSEAISSESDANRPLIRGGADSPDPSASSSISTSERGDGEYLIRNIKSQSSSSPEPPELPNSPTKSCNRTVVSIGRNTEAQSESLVLKSSAEDIGFKESFLAASPAGKSKLSPARERTTPKFSTPANAAQTLSSPFSPSSPIGQCASTPAATTSSPTCNVSSSEEESDLDSLPSYNPPPKIIDFPSAERLAKRLFMLDGFRKMDVSRHLSRNNDFNRVVAEEYLKFFGFSGDTLDASLKKFLDNFCLTGETQERERVLLHFSKRYLECNPAVAQGPNAWFRSQDSVHTLTCAIMLLNTDLHGDNHLQRKMTCGEFIENLSELNDGFDFPRELLKSIYYAIKREAIPWSNETEMIMMPAAADAPNSGQNVDFPQQTVEICQPAMWRQRAEVSAASGAAETVHSTSNIHVGRAAGGINPFLTLPDSQSANDYKKGYVMRKCCFDANGRRTKFGKRSWRMYFLSLRDTVLYCFKDEKSLRQQGAFEDLNCAIRIHHGLAEVASDYSKKQYVFRLRTSDQALYLFQTSDEKELVTWIDAINFVVARLSAPPLPPPCSSELQRFQRPLMPSSRSNLSFADQLSWQENLLPQLRCQIEEHLQAPPPKNAKTGQTHAYHEKKEFLRLEISRYETYILALKTRSAAAAATGDGGGSGHHDRSF